MASFPDYYSVLGPSLLSGYTTTPLTLLTHPHRRRSLRYTRPFTSPSPSPPLRRLTFDALASQDQIKTAYKRKSLLCHPDRVPAGPGSEIKRKAATTEFQAVADAYYTLSDTGELNLTLSDFTPEAGRYASQEEGSSALLSTSHH